VGSDATRRAMRAPVRILSVLESLRTIVPGMSPVASPHEFRVHAAQPGDILGTTGDNEGILGL
jgi:hypothetical protein